MSGEWEAYVHDDMRQKFKAAFIEMIAQPDSKICDDLLCHLAFYGQRHHYNDCPHKNDKGHNVECYECYGDSTDRDMGESNHMGLGDLWRSIFGKLKIKPISDNEDVDANGDDDAEEGQDNENEDK